MPAASRLSSRRSCQTLAPTCNRVQLPITLRALAPPCFIEAVPRQVLHGLSVLRRPPRPAAAFERACVRGGRALRQSLKCKHKLRCKFSLPFQHGLASRRRAAGFAFEQHARAHLSQPVLPQGMQASPHIIGQGRAFVLHRANPSVEGTDNGGARLRASATMAAPLSAPHLKR